MGAVLLSPLYILLNLYLISRMLLWFSTLHSFLGTPWFIAPFLSCYVLIALSPLMAAFSHGQMEAGKPHHQQLLARHADVHADLSAAV